MVVRWKEITEDDVPKIKEFLDSFAVFLVYEVDTILEAHKLILNMPDKIRRGTNTFFGIHWFGYSTGIELVVNEGGCFLIGRQIRSGEDYEDEIIWDVGEVEFNGRGGQGRAKG